MRQDENCFSIWFPKIEAAGLPVPKTRWRKFTEPDDLIRVYDGEPSALLPIVVEWIAGAAREIGYPCFLRTGLTSGKHEWRDTCYLPDEASIERHVANLVEYSNTVDLFGLPTDVWVVRELLKTDPLAVSERWHGFPISREWRFFVRDGKVECCHPYWPLEALEQARPGATDPTNEELYRDLSRVDTSIEELARRAGLVVGGFWSVDVLWTTGGWVVTDMARGEMSYHEPH